MSDEKIWFYEKDGERKGPVEPAAISQLLAEAEITEESLVWKEGMSDWAPLKTTELLPASGARPTPPPVPPRERQVEETGGTAAGGNVLQPVVEKEDIPVREAVLRDGFQIQIRSSLGRAWELMKSDFWPFVGMYALMAVMYSVASQLGVTVFFLMFPILVGFNWYVLRRMRGETASIDDLFFGFKRGFGNLAILNLVLVSPIIIVIIFAVAAFFGIVIYVEEGGGSDETAIVLAASISILLFLFFVVVGGILSMLGYLACLLIVDCDWPWKKALSNAWRACRGNLLKIILFYFIVTSLSFLGLFLFYVGAFLTGTWASMAISQVYEDAFGDSRE